MPSLVKIALKTPSLKNTNIVDVAKNIPPSKSKNTGFNIFDYLGPKSAIAQSLAIGTKPLFQPISKSVGLSTAEELTEKKVTPKLIKSQIKGIPTGLQPGVLGATALETGANLIDLAQTPVNIITGETLGLLGKAISKIPYKGTTLGEVASKLPIQDIFKPDVAERIKYQTALKNLPITTEISRKPFEEIKGTINPVSKITQFLKEAKPLRTEQEKLYSAERAIRSGEVAKIQQQKGGEAGFYQELGKLKGELPKVKFESVKTKLTQGDLDYLFNRVKINNTLLPLEKTTTQFGLLKLLKGEIPTEGELGLLGEVFPKDFVDTILSKRDILTKTLEGAGNVLNIPRALMASLDMSAPFRQGIFLSARYPVLATKAFKEQFKYFFSEKSYQGLLQEIQKRPNYPLMREAKLPLTSVGGRLLQQEEKFLGNLTEKIPFVRASNRAYTGYLNKLRADVFDYMVNTAKQQGVKLEGKTLTDLGKFIGSATGRGQLPGGLEQGAVILNGALFSPRLMASRLNLLNPHYYIKLDPFVRKEAIKSLFAFTGMVTTVLTLAKMGGAEIETNPTNADFAKIKIGNTRYDVAGGFQQYIRLAAQIVTQKITSSTTGLETKLGEGYKPLTTMDILQRFIESKEAPVLSFVTSLAKGKSIFGKELNIPEEIKNRFTPMLIQDMIDLYKDKGAVGVPMVLPGFFGIGVQTYSPTSNDVVYIKRSIEKHAKEFLRQGRKQEAVELLSKNKNRIEVAKKLEPLQKNIDEYNRFKNKIQNFTLIDKNKKKILLDKLDRKIKANQIIMDKLYEKESK